MLIEQYILSYRVNQDMLRAILPEGFTSLKPVLRLKAEVYDNQGTYLEFNTPAEKDGKKGWLNISSWNELRFERDGKKCTFRLPFLDLSFESVGIMGPAPSLGELKGTFFTGRKEVFREDEEIHAEKEFCDSRFIWKFTDDDARGTGHGPTVKVEPEEVKEILPKKDFTVFNAAAVPCIEVVESYGVMYEKANRTQSNAMQQFAKLIKGEI